MARVLAACGAAFLACFSWAERDGRRLAPTQPSSWPVSTLLECPVSRTTPDLKERDRSLEEMASWGTYLMPS